MAPPLSQEMRLRIISLKNSGHHITHISRETGVTRATIYFWLKRWEESGSIKAHRRQNYERATTAAQDQEIVEAHRQQPSLSLRSTSYRYNTSLLTIRRRLREAGIKIPMGPKKIVMWPLHKQDNIEVSDDEKLKKDMAVVTEDGPLMENITLDKAMAEDTLQRPQDFVTQDLDTQEIDTQELNTQDLETQDSDTLESKRKIWEIMIDRVCQECKEIITGFRYRCIEGCAYDACAACEHRGAHAHHHMLRIPPAATTWETIHKLEALKQRIQLEIDRLLVAIKVQEQNMSPSCVKMDVEEKAKSELVDVKSCLPNVCSESATCTTTDASANGGSYDTKRDHDYCQGAIAVKEEPEIYFEEIHSTKLHEMDPLRIKAEPPECGSDSSSRRSSSIRHSATRIKITKPTILTRKRPALDLEP